MEEMYWCLMFIKVISQYRGLRQTNIGGKTSLHKEGKYSKHNYVYMLQRVSQSGNRHGAGKLLLGGGGGLYSYNYLIYKLLNYKKTT
jgi:hypothetical protein